MLFTGDVKEEIYDNLRISLDIDSKGNTYELSSTRLITSRCEGEVEASFAVMEGGVALVAVFRAGTGLA